MNFGWDKLGLGTDFGWILVKHIMPKVILVSFGALSTFPKSRFFPLLLLLSVQLLFTSNKVMST